jgi:adenylate kinase family enzyme
MDVRLKPAVICFSSLMGAGKSTLAISLANSLGWPHTSFGGYVREIAQQRGSDQSREALQQIGEELISTNVQTFSQAVISQIDWRKGCVIDGIRHNQVLQAIKNIVNPLPTFLVFVNIDESVRRKRLHERGMTDNQIDAADGHSTETQVRARLKQEADIVLDGSRDIPDLVMAVRTLIHGKHPG